MSDEWFKYFEKAGDLLVELFHVVGLFVIGSDRFPGEGSE